MYEIKVKFIYKENSMNHLRTYFYGVLFFSVFLTYSQINEKVEITQEQVIAQPTQPAQPAAETPKESYLMQPTNLGLSGENQNAIVKTLRSLLADNYVLYTKALNFHWNVQGDLFSQLHEFFKTLYEHLQAGNDLLAERMRALGSFSPGSLQEFLSLTQLKENDGRPLPYMQMINTLLTDFQVVIRSVRQATEQSAEFSDWGTNNMLASMLEQLEKDAWMLRAHLQGNPAKPL